MGKTKTLNRKCEKCGNEIPKYIEDKKGKKKRVSKRKYCFDCKPFQLRIMSQFK